MPYGKISGEEKFSNLALRGWVSSQLVTFLSHSTNFITHNPKKVRKKLQNSQQSCRLKRSKSRLFPSMVQMSVLKRDPICTMRKQTRMASPDIGTLVLVVHHKSMTPGDSKWNELLVTFKSLHSKEFFDILESLKLWNWHHGYSHSKESVSSKKYTHTHRPYHSELRIEMRFCVSPTLSLGFGCLKSERIRRHFDVECVSLIHDSCTERHKCWRSKAVEESRLFLLSYIQRSTDFWNHKSGIWVGPSTRHYPGLTFWLGSLIWVQKGRQQKRWVLWLKLADQAERSTIGKSHDCSPWKMCFFIPPYSAPAVFLTQCLKTY